MTSHQFIERESGRVATEKLFGDSVVRWLYSEVRERAPDIYKMAISQRITDLLGLVNYDLPFLAKITRSKDFVRESGINLEECVDAPGSLNTLRKIFERQIQYWKYRPLPSDSNVVVSPADARVLVGSFDSDSALYLKGKFFGFEQLLGSQKLDWLAAFESGDFAVFRLTPDKYHYNHTPVAGVVKDFYEVVGSYHACNPTAIVIEVTPFSKNTRTITIIDTDVEGGSRVGRVAMIEVTALMIGAVVQCYSRDRYESPRAIEPGRFVERGCPKSLYRPGSSTDVLLFEKGRVAFDSDLLANQRRNDVNSRFSQGFGRQLVETEVQVRSRIASKSDDRGNKNDK